MKLIFECFQCSEEEREKFMQSTEPITIPLEEIFDSQIIVDIVDDNVYHFKCKKGHHNICYLANPKFEILYESGIYAMLDGYYAESVLTLTAALERAYEFFIENVSYKNGIDPNTYKSVFKKLFSNQSERQIGAFYFLYLNTLKKDPLEFKEKEFRNSVIHKGKIPKDGETEKYARHIFDLIKSIYVDTIESVGVEYFRDNYMQIKYLNSLPILKDLHEKYPTDQASSVIPTMLYHGLELNLYKQRDYDTALLNSICWKEKQSDPFKHFKNRAGIVINQSESI